MNRRFCRVIYLSTHWQCLVIFEANRILPLKQSIFNATNQWTKSTRFLSGVHDMIAPPPSVSTCRAGHHGKSGNGRPPRSTQRTRINLFLTGSTFEKSPHMRAAALFAKCGYGKRFWEQTAVFSINRVKCLIFNYVDQGKISDVHRRDKKVLQNAPSSSFTIPATTRVLHQKPCISYLQR